MSYTPKISKRGLPAAIIGLIFAILASFASSVWSLGVKAGHNTHDLSPYFVVLVRSVILLFLVLSSMSCCATPSFRMPETPPVKPKHPGTRLFILTMAGFFSWATTLVTSLAVVELSMANAAIFSALGPLIAALLSPLIGESISPATIKALPLALCGVVLVCHPPFLVGGPTEKFHLVGALLGLSQAVFNAATKLTIRNMESESITHILLAISIVSTAAMAVQGWAMPYTMELPASQPAWMLLGIACIGGVAYQWLAAESLKRTKAASVLAMMYCSTLWGLVWDALVFDSFPDRYDISGALLIFGGSYLLISEYSKAYKHKEQLLQALSVPEYDEEVQLKQPKAKQKPKLSSMPPGVKKSDH